MRLTIFLERMIKPVLNTRTIYTEEDLGKLGYVFVTKYNQDREERFPTEHLHEVTQPVTLRYYYFDMHSLWEAFKERYPNIYKGDLPPDFATYLVSSQIDGDTYTYVHDDVKTYNGVRPRIRLTLHGREELLKYYKSRLTIAYVYKIEKPLAIHRGELSETGMKLLPRNLAYCFDKSVVQRLVDEGGLSPEFLDKWIDGETAIFPELREF